MNVRDLLKRDLQPEYPKTRQAREDGTLGTGFGIIKHECGRVGEMKTKLESYLERKYGEKRVKTTANIAALIIFAIFLFFAAFVIYKILSAVFADRSSFMIALSGVSAYLLYFLLAIRIRDDERLNGMTVKEFYKMTYAREVKDKKGKNKIIAFFQIPFFRRLSLLFFAIILVLCISGYVSYYKEERLETSAPAMIVCAIAVASLGMLLWVLSFTYRHIKDKRVSAAPQNHSSQEKPIFENKNMERETTQDDIQQNEEKREVDIEEEITEEPSCSIYEYIKKNTKDGALPEGFKIPWLDSIWAPGAHDGIVLNHMVPLVQMPSEEREGKILEALKLMADENNGEHLGEVFEIFEKLDGEYGIVRLYDAICGTIGEHAQELNLPKLLMCADGLLCHGVSLLAVKLGLTILSVFLADFVEEVMMEMGIYDEFTYYAARTLSRDAWPKGNEELFDLAQKTHGWGRIHAVDWLRPDTQEIKDWLLFEGSKNTVMAQYSSDMCLQKAAAIERLEGSPSAEEYKAIGELIRESLESGGPCPGLTDGEQLLTKYAEKANEYLVDQEILEMIVSVADEYNLSEETRQLVQKLANSNFPHE